MLDITGHELTNTISCRKLNLSVNEHLVNKDIPVDNRYFAEGFVACDDGTIEDLAWAVSEGYAFSYCFLNDYRHEKNFLKTDILAVDIDGGLPIDECLSIPVVRDYASLLYTTPNHSEAEHRYRLVFVLPRTLTDPIEVRFANRALAQRLGGDMAATDPARLYFGNSTCEPMILGKELSYDALRQLIEEGRTDVKTDYTSRPMPSGMQSYFRMEPDQPIQLENGSTVSFSEITTKQVVHCPFHHDTHASAFVSKVNKTGNLFLYCSSCKKTWWPKGSVPSSTNFRDFDEHVKSLKEQGFFKGDDGSSPLSSIMEPNWVHPANIHLQQERYLNTTKLNVDFEEAGITLIKSPKGSGKTTFLSQILKKRSEAPAVLDDFDDEIETGSTYDDQKVLLIGHRQALIGELCERLGLNCYLDYSENSGQNRLSKKKQRFGVCLDSLWRVEGRKYDLVVIDEVEQVLGHFLSDTIGASRNRIFSMFFQIIRDAKHVIALDADLGWASFNTLRMIKTMKESPCGIRFSETAHTPISVVLNEWKTNDRVVSLFKDKDHLIDEMKEAILSGKRIYVSSNSKRLIGSLDKAIEHLEEEEDLKIPRITITSKNSKTDDVQAFILNITDEVLKYSAILSSPSLGTGIDITFKNNASEIDVVFGFFESQVTNHFEIDQQLARVRHPKEVKVWINPCCFRFETEFDVVVDDILRTDLNTSIMYGMSWQDRMQLPDRDPFLTMVAHLTAKNRASFNNLRANFVAHKELQGWDVQIIARDADRSENGEFLRELGNTRNKLENAEKVLNSKPLNRVEFAKLNRLINYNSGAITEEEYFRLFRTRFELFFRTPPAEDLIVLDDFGRLRRHIRCFDSCNNNIRRS